MIDRGLLRTAAESATEAAGSSLARSLPGIPVTIALSGPLGAGKTAFMRGFLRELGVTDPVTSPTYALEQRYGTSRGEVLHVDLYRLDEAEARALLATSDGHRGIRCVEWPEKAGGALACGIRVTIAEESGGTRAIDIACDDVAWPDDATIDRWRDDMKLPRNVGAHCDAVAGFCERAAAHLLAHGTFVRTAFVRAGAKLHDLMRFVDFSPAAAPAGWKETPEERDAWEAWKRLYPQPTHEEAAEAFLRDRGYPALGALVGSHTVHRSPAERRTTEEHLLYYADKRFVGDAPVTVEKRYHDFGVRYGNGTRSEKSHRWERETLDTEALLFPDGPPF